MELSDTVSKVIDEKERNVEGRDKEEECAEEEEDKEEKGKLVGRRVLVGKVAKEGKEAEKRIWGRWRV